MLRSLYLLAALAACETAYAVPPFTPGSDVVTATYYAPDTRLVPAVVSLINSASTSVNIAASVLTDPQITSALALAASRGVAVQGVFPSTSGTSQVSGYKAIIASGGSAWLAPFADTAANRFITCDGGTNATGTYYWSRSAIQTGNWEALTTGTASTSNFDSTFGSLQATGTRQTSMLSPAKGNDMSINPETELAYATSLAKKLTNEIGFIPSTRYADAQEKGRLLIQTLNDDPCGFLVFGPPFKGRVHVWQTAVQVDARRQAAATALLEKLKHYATTKSAFEIVLRCRHDLEANGFWTAAGFRHFATSQGGKSRGGMIYHYSLPLVTKQHKLFPDEVEQCPYPSLSTSHRSAGSKPQQSALFKQLTLALT